MWLEAYFRYSVLFCSTTVILNDTLVWFSYPGAWWMFALLFFGEATSEGFGGAEFFFSDFAVYLSLNFVSSGRVYEWNSCRVEEEEGLCCGRRGSVGRCGTERPEKTTK